jgi:hypothetical protein
MIRDGDSTGWLMTGFFALAILIAIFDPWLEKFRLQFSQYKLVITPDDVACEHRKRKRESIRWEDVNRVWYVTTDDGPWVPDEWFLFEGENGGCSFPTEANGMNAMWDELEQRFPGLDYKPIIQGPINGRETSLLGATAWTCQRAEMSRRAGTTSSIASVN